MTELPDLLETFHISIGDVGAIRLELPELGMNEMIQAADYMMEIRKLPTIFSYLFLEGLGYLLDVYVGELNFLCIS